MWREASAYLLKMMQLSDLGDCPANCSGHGDCNDGVCVCELEYQGTECDDINNAYFVAFGLIFYLLSICCTIQLILCIQSDFRRLKNPSFQKALRVTTQKLLYVLVIIAALSRALYFSLQPYLSETWASNMMSMYYPLLLSCFSLVVCFWAEAFHLSEKQHNNPGFLRDSFRYFILFNVLLYILLVAEFITMETTSSDHQILGNVFNGCFAGLMTIEVIFFLAYGVEVFFKIKGAFTVNYHSTNQQPTSAIGQNSLKASGQSTDQSPDLTVHVSSQSVDVSIMHQSRIGLLFQGLLQIVMVLFLMLNVTEPQWRESLPVLKRNVHDVLFRIVEVGLALWFPCVLWKSRSPESLWMLNPTRLFRQTRDEEKSQGGKKEEDWLLCRTRAPTYDSTADSSKVEKEVECWICYDHQRTDAGPMIQPCECKGDVAYVHHECLKRWLMESADNPEALQCKVCQSKYQLKTGSANILKGFQLKQGLFTAIALGIMTAGPVAVYFVMKKYPSDVVSVVSIGACIFLEMVCLKYLGISLCNAYNRASISSLHIIGKMVNRPETVVTTTTTTPTTSSSESSATSASCTSSKEPSVSIVSVSVIGPEVSSDGVQVHHG
ncbi:uncharacterized protein LOC119734397 isoform X2 [Patiria miniata]|uniref:RING-CH-type domain-containing protein n=1 Tax=Patiria miniata TaxID=46514 RepID=A0A914AJM9_PATMI|nr:uncharacterized protein LOC119734397 isoform X1 [Patiria miniata]XP_038063824.1 uncharacterized protein LOC119734397 isoform X2 [Patiria miniata]